MTDSQRIELLATLPVKDIDDLRLMVSLAFYRSHKDRHYEIAIYWANLLNKSSEWKQAQALRGLDDTEYDTLYQNAQ
jgi:hypothetical protein